MVKLNCRRTLSEPNVLAVGNGYTEGTSPGNCWAKKEKGIQSKKQKSMTGSDHHDDLLRLVTCKISSRQTCA